VELSEDVMCDWGTETADVFLGLKMKKSMIRDVT
jgi:hypothetical protein